MAEEDSTKSTPFIVGMVFFGIGVILMVAIIILVMYFCIYRRKRKQFEKKKYLTMDNSIVYTKSPPSLDLRPPSISKEVSQNGNIQTVTTMSPLESPNTIYTIENGPHTDQLLTTAANVEPKLSHSFDSVDHAPGGSKRYVLQEVYAVDGATTKKNKRQNKKKQHNRVKKAYSSYSWNRRGGGSLLGTKPRPKDRYARSERGYRTAAYTNEGFYHSDTLNSRKSGKHYYGSNPTLVRLQPVSFATMPGQRTPSLSSSQRLYVVSDNPKPLASQSVILNRSPPRSPRSPRFALSRSLDTFEDGHAVKHGPHGTSQEHVLLRDNSTEGNYIRWSPSMKRKLEEKERGRVSRSNSDLTSISRRGRRRGIGEHKYIYDPKYGTLEQF